MRRFLSAAAAVASVEACHAYAVVDPIPAPARCGGVAALFRASVSWSSPDSVVIVLVLPDVAAPSTTESGQKPDRSVGFADAPYVSFPVGAKITRTRVEPGRVEIEVLVPPIGDEASLMLSQPVHCSAGTQTISVQVRMRVRAGAATPDLTFELYDYP